MAESMDEGTFDDLASETLEGLEGALADLDDRLEVSLSMGVLTLAFENGPRFVINSHRAAKQIWMAAHSSAWHFDWDGSQWVSTKSGEGLHAVLEHVLSEELGRKVHLRQP